MNTEIKNRYEKWLNSDKLSTSYKQILKSMT